ncbi:hypothetical protein [Holospora curviuscula]|uniref:Uncharacterized protein n=1 Tax=Holospora curviuscula TaxID=1082868 RepID=A0A2S5RIA5_9PROT|nr:hypothetical protein [Holospora curviuscula]PPE06895.1 hypothetical protein HCUR_00109 [Holospora curviuscula]
MKDLANHKQSIDKQETNKTSNKIQHGLRSLLNTVAVLVARNFSIQNTLKAQNVQYGFINPFNTPLLDM